jgi:histidinol-phosphate phosphatase family protein
MSRGLVILDRDGVINKLIINLSTKISDSPMRLKEIEVFPWVRSCLKFINEAGYGICIATNQPAWSKGKVDLLTLIKVHETIVQLAQYGGGIILSSHICFHRAENDCKCRKPKPGLLEEASLVHSEFDKNKSWMVGDKVTDIMAGQSFGIKTALLNEDFPDNINPTYYGHTLEDFVNYLIK